MNNNLIKTLASRDIFPYGSAELMKFENTMIRYFEREYERWQGNRNLPESYGVSSFEGKVANKKIHNISVSHYDEEYNVYLAFLDKNYMAYTMGYFGVNNSPSEIQNISLEQAQINKYKLLIERADIKDGQTILDLGCGFGGFSRYLLNTFPAINIIGINPSEVQTNHIRNSLLNNINKFDSSRFTLIQTYFDDIENIDIEKNYFDRVISIGLLEHISNIDLLQKNISYVLKHKGKCLHHCIVSYDTLPGFLNSEDTYMGTYYPGAHIWPYQEPQRHDRYLKFTNSWFINGMNYWKTLDDWHRRFWDSIEQLYPEHVSIDEIGKWNKYFSLCKAMFYPNNGNSYGNGQFLYEKTQA
jgi:cyclopropane-fatty-acyl-phospholipid synthase